MREPKSTDLAEEKRAAERNQPIPRPVSSEGRWLPRIWNVGRGIYSATNPSQLVRTIANHTVVPLARATGNQTIEQIAQFGVEASVFVAGPVNYGLSRLGSAMLRPVSSRILQPLRNRLPDSFAGRLADDVLTIVESEATSFVSNSMVSSTRTLMEGTVSRNERSAPHRIEHKTQSPHVHTHVPVHTRLHPRIESTPVPSITSQRTSLPNREFKSVNPQVNEPSHIHRPPSRSQIIHPTLENPSHPGKITPTPVIKKTSAETQSTPLPSSFLHARKGTRLGTKSKRTPSITAELTHQQLQEIKHSPVLEPSLKKRKVVGTSSEKIATTAKLRNFDQQHEIEISSKIAQREFKSASRKHPPRSKNRILHSKSTKSRQALADKNAKISVATTKHSIIKSKFEKQSTSLRRSTRNASKRQGTHTHSQQLPESTTLTHHHSAKIRSSFPKEPNYKKRKVAETRSAPPRMFSKRSNSITSSSNTNAKARINTHKTRQLVKIRTLRRSQRIAGKSPLSNTQSQQVPQATSELMLNHLSETKSNFSKKLNAKKSEVTAKQPFTTLPQLRRSQRIHFLVKKPGDGEAVVTFSAHSEKTTQRLSRKTQSIRIPVELAQEANALSSRDELKLRHNQQPHHGYRLRTRKVNGLAVTLAEKELKYNEIKQEQKNVYENEKNKIDNNQLATTLAGTADGLAVPEKLSDEKRVSERVSTPQKAQEENTPLQKSAVAPKKSSQINQASFFNKGRQNQFSKKSSEKVTAADSKQSTTEKPPPAAPAYIPPARNAAEVMNDGQNLARDQGLPGNPFRIANQTAIVLATNRWGEDQSQWNWSLISKWEGQLYDSIKSKKSDQNTKLTISNILNETQAQAVVPALYHAYSTGQPLTPEAKVQLTGVAEQQQMIAVAFTRGVNQMFQNSGFTPLSSIDLQDIHDGVMHELTGPTHGMDERIVKVARPFVKTHASADQWDTTINVGLYNIEQNSQAFAEGRWNGTPASEVHPLPREHQSHTKIINDLINGIKEGASGQSLQLSGNTEKIVGRVSDNPQSIAIWERDSAPQNIIPVTMTGVTQPGADSRPSSSSLSQTPSPTIGAGISSLSADISTNMDFSIGDGSMAYTLPYLKPISDNSLKLPIISTIPTSTPNLTTTNNSQTEPFMELASGIKIYSSSQDSKPNTTADTKERNTLPLSMAQVGTDVLSELNGSLGSGMVSKVYEAASHGLNFISHREDAIASGSENPELSALFRMGAEEAIDMGLKSIPKVGNPLAIAVTVSQLLNEIAPPEKDHTLFPKVDDVKPEMSVMEKIGTYALKEEIRDSQASLDVLRAPGQLVNFFSSQIATVVDQLPGSGLSTQSLAEQKPQVNPTQSVSVYPGLFSSSSTTKTNKESTQQTARHVNNANSACSRSVCVSDSSLQSHI